MIYSAIMTGPLSYFIAIMMAGFVLGFFALFIGLIILDMALIGLGLSVIFVQAVIVVGLYKVVDRRMRYSEHWLKDAVGARSAERETPQRELPEDFRPHRPLPEDSQDEQAPILPRGLFYVSALLLLSSVFIIAYVWESPRLALFWLLTGITLYLVSRLVVNNRSS